MRLCLIALLVMWLGGCASALGGGYGQGGLDASGRSYADARADNRITAAVTSALVRDREVPAMDIEVRTLKGVVTLSGTAPSTTIALRAERLAAAVAGVVRVENRLQISR